MLNSNWVDINKLAEILGFNVETLRRSCANNKYINRFKKSGKYKHYEIDITSLPKNYLNKYNKYFEKDNNLQFNSDEYSNAQEWQRKQADKYLELLSLYKLLFLLHLVLPVNLNILLDLILPLTFLIFQGL